MPDVFTIEKRSEVMSRIRSRGNKETELALMKIFRKAKITGWRRHALLKFKVQGSRFKVGKGKLSKVQGPKSKVGSPRGHPPSSILHSRLRPYPRPFTVRPDFVFSKLKVAVLVDGCFWHGCPKHSNLPVGNRAFWRRKFAVNRARDRRVNRLLRRAGWRVVRIWEHELRHERALLRRLQRVLVS